MDDTPLPQPPLRVRKRLRDMRRIQSVALELFERDGFDSVSIERIADLAEVSPSSVYRWFGTKESLVTWDEYDSTAFTELEAELASGIPPVRALRHFVDNAVLAPLHQDPDRIATRNALVEANPSIEADTVRRTFEMAHLIAASVREHSPAAGDDLDIEIAAHAFVGALFGALRHAHTTGGTTPLEQVVDRAFHVLELTLSDAADNGRADRSPDSRR